jgi:hypothetical protein
MDKTKWISPAQVSKRLKFSSAFIFVFCTIRWAPQLWIIDKIMHTDSRQWWQGFQNDSDSLVISRLSGNLTHGFFSAYGAMGELGSYNSQFGLNVWLNTIISSMLTSSKDLQIFILYSLTALGNALLVLAVLHLINTHLGKIPTLVAFILIIQPWPSAMFHSVYWSIWVKFLPAVATYFVFRLKIPKARSFIIVTSCSIFTFLSGYEFSTMVMMGAISVVFLLEKFELAHLKSSAKIILLVAISILTGFFCALFIHFIQLVNLLGSANSASKFLLETITKRTGATSFKVNSAFTESLLSSPIQVLDTYLEFPVIGSPKIFPVVSTVSIAAAIAIVYLLSLVTISLIPDSASYDLKKCFAAWLLGLLGPLGWIFLARPHSYIHTHINFSLWYLFTIPLGGALITRSLLLIKEQIPRIKDLLFLSLLTAVIVLCFTFYSLIAVGI